MRLVIRTSVLFLCIFSSFTTSAANRFWVSAGALNWSNAAGWSATSGGAPGASVPGVADAIFFDGNGLGNCNGDIAVTVISISIGAGYTGTISQNTNTIVLTGTATMSGGTFTGGTSNITVGGAFTLSGTALTSTSGILELRDNAAFTSGTFLHNNGTVKFNCVNNPAETITGTAPVFYALEFVGIGRTYTMSALVGSITVMNSLNTSGASFYNLAGGTINVKGNINSSNTATGSGGDATININGNIAQTFTGSTVVGAGALPQLNINTTGTVSLINNPAVSNNFTYTAGTVNAGTSTFCFTHGNAGTYNINGSLTLNNISFPVNTSLLTLTIVGTLTATGDLDISGAGGLLLNTGNIDVNGNINLTNTATNGGGSATIDIVGTGAQNLDGSAIIIDESRLPLININKASGTLSLLGNISFAGNLTYTAGTINAGVSICFLVNNLSINGIFSVYNLTVQTGSGATITVASGSIITATNTLDLENGANLININTGTIAVQGNIIDNNTSVGGGGNGIILINGTANQTITTTGVTDEGRFPGVTINKPSGTLTFPSLITVVGNWTYSTGTLNVTTNNSTVIFAGDLTITGNHSLNNISFEGSNNYTFIIAPSTTLTVLGNMAITGTFNVTLNTGTINLIGDLNLTNTSTGDGGNTVIAFTGTTNQAIHSSLLVNQSTLPAVSINKASGVLTFPALITVFGNWTFVTGTYDVSTNNTTIEFAGDLSFTGSHSLNNVVFESTNNWTFVVNTGTIITVTGTLTTTGNKNIFLDAPVMGTTAIQANGDIIINNTSVTGGGTALILINGPGSQAITGNAAASQGLLPFIKIQKPSGTLTLNGTISVSKDWTWVSGAVLPTTSSLIFGGSNLTITSAGMSFYNVTIAGNTSTLANSLTLLNNLNIIGTAILSPVANTINLAGNWSNWGSGGFTEATSTVNLNGSSLQTITTPGGENFTNMIVDNSAAGIQIANAVAVATSLTMTLGNIDLNTHVLTLGTTVVSNGTLVHTSGTMINTGSFLRWFKTGAIAAGSVTGLFPMGTATDYRPLFLSAPVTGPTTGGTIGVAYTDATTNTTVSIPDGIFTVVVRKDLRWTTTTANGLAGGTYNMQIQGTGYGLIGAVSDLRITLAAAVVGTAGVNAGTVFNPQINRTGLTVTDLTNSFFIGSINAVSTPLPVELVFFTVVPKNQTVDITWETATETQNDYFTVLRSKDGKEWESVAKIKGQGNTGSSSFYETFDQNPFSGLSFYKLENTDLDGHSYFSSVRSVNFAAGHDISVYPNPAVNTIIISGSGITSLRLMQNNGQTVPVNISTSGDTKILDVSGLPSGVYFIQITHGVVTETKTVAISR
jgi:Secretion system C-terminal sorting domain